METFLILAFFTLTTVIAWLIPKMGWIIRDLRRERDGILKALRHEREKVRGYRSNIASLNSANEALEAELALARQDYEPSQRLAAKLATARATKPAQDERLKHQNNEMRVAMSRMNRLLGDAVGAILRTERASGINMLDIRGAVDQAQRCWTDCNNWLTLNRIEPYEGPVPGYDGQIASEREKEVAPQL